MREKVLQRLLKAEHQSCKSPNLAEGAEEQYITPLNQECIKPGGSCPVAVRPDEWEHGGLPSSAIAFRYHRLFLAIGLQAPSPFSHPPECRAPRGWPERSIPGLSHVPFPLGCSLEIAMVICMPRNPEITLESREDAPLVLHRE